MADPYEEIYDDNEDVYNEGSLEELEDDDEISPGEEGFMKGYNKAGKMKKKKKK